MSPVSGEHSGDHNHQDFQNVLRNKWEAYCNTNGRRTAIQIMEMGGVLTVSPFPQTEVLRYKLEAYCNTNGRCIAILFWEVVVVGVSDILLSKGNGWTDGPVRGTDPPVTGTEGPQRLLRHSGSPSAHAVQLPPPIPPLSASLLFRADDGQTANLYKDL